MRKLQTRDIFTFAKMINKMELKDELKIFFARIKSGGSDEKSEGEKPDFVSSALDIVMIIIKNLPGAETEFYEFVAPILERSHDEVKEFSIEELISYLLKIYKDVNFASFFKSAVI